MKKWLYPVRWLSLLILLYSSSSYAVFPDEIRSRLDAELLKEEALLKISSHSPENERKAIQAIVNRLKTSFFSRNR